MNEWHTGTTRAGNLRQSNGVSNCQVLHIDVELALKQRDCLSGTVFRVDTQVSEPESTGAIYFRSASVPILLCKSRLGRQTWPSKVPTACMPLCFYAPYAVPGALYHQLLPTALEGEREALFLFPFFLVGQGLSCRTRRGEWLI